MEVLASEMVREALGDLSQECQDLLQVHSVFAVVGVLRHEHPLLIDLLVMEPIHHHRHVHDDTAEEHGSNARPAVMIQPKSRSCIRVLIRVDIRLQLLFPHGSIAPERPLDIIQHGVSWFIRSQRHQSRC